MSISKSARGYWRDEPKLVTPAVPLVRCCKNMRNIWLFLHPKTYDWFGFTTKQTKWWTLILSLRHFSISVISSTARRSLRLGLFIPAQTREVVNHSGMFLLQMKKMSRKHWKLQLRLRDHGRWRHSQKEVTFWSNGLIKSRIIERVWYLWLKSKVGSL